MIMNAAQRKQIERVEALLSEARCILEELRDDLQAAFDEKSERWQESERGEAAQEEIDNLENACASVEEIEGSLADFHA
jgi:chromosome condensin MukBEF complex kleisin-like MukF subunit